jgi:hypothetical protein
MRMAAMKDLKQLARCRIGGRKRIFVISLDRGTAIENTERSFGTVPALCRWNYPWSTARVALETRH